MELQRRSIAAAAARNWDRWPRLCNRGFGRGMVPPSHLRGRARHLQKPPLRRRGLPHRDLRPHPSTNSQGLEEAAPPQVSLQARCRRHLPRRPRPLHRRRRRRRRQGPSLLCADVEKTLSSNVAGLTGLGFSRSEIARLVLLGRERFRSRSVVSQLQGYLPLFGSSENLLRAIVFNTNILTYNLETTVKHNLVFLRDCGLGACDIAKLCVSVPRMLTANTERVRAMVACVEGVGAPLGSPMFKHALRAVSFLSEEKIAARVEFLKKTCRWSDSEVGVALSKSPAMLKSSEDKLQRTSEFLISEVGLVPAYTAHRPAMLSYSLEARLRPRYYVVKFLKANGFLDRERSYYSAVMVTEKVFVGKYTCPHKEGAPHLAEDYADACRGKVPMRFRFE